MPSHIHVKIIFISVNSSMNLLMIIDDSLSVHLLLSFIIGLTLWNIGLAINLKLLYELKGKEKILNIETINEMKKINI